MLNIRNIKIVYFFLALIILFLVALCHKPRNYLEEALTFAGDNRPELEKVLSHYSSNPADSLKLQAAKFLIENMPGHYSIIGGDKLNDSFKAIHHPETNQVPGVRINKISLMNQMQPGSCADKVTLTTLLMRSQGIPVVTDKTPQWPYRNGQHEWNVVRKTQGKNTRFAGGESNPGEEHKDDEKLAKAYRVIYQINRYWRYVGPEESHGNVAELLFYQNGQIQNKTGIPVCCASGSHTVNAAFDNDPLTYFDATEATGAWVGLDFRYPVTIDSVAIVPRFDGNSVYIGDVYEISYWDKTGWISLGKQKAGKFMLEYTNAPGNALFFIHNITRGKEDRIFMYEQGKQILL